MAFITQGTQVISFATYDDAERIDQRVFEENEGLSVDDVEDALIRSTERILDILLNTAWYRRLALSQGASVLTIPTPSANKIVSRKNDFTDLCVFYALQHYLLPKVADFGNQDNAERVKIDFYLTKFNTLLDELLSNGDWYDYDGNGSVSTVENQPYPINYQRVR
jgi:hypothetical protein